MKKLGLVFQAENDTYNYQTLIAKYVVMKQKSREKTRHKEVRAKRKNYGRKT